jgi:hypothetical protein
MATARVKNTHLHFNGVNYFRGKATNVQLGSYGEKKTPIAKENYLEIQSCIPPKLISKAKAFNVSIDSESQSSLNFGAEVTAIIKGVPVKFKGDAAIDKIKKEELKLVLFSVSMEGMKNAINNAPNHLENLKNYGKDARIAVEVFVILEATLASEITSSGSVDISGSKEEIAVSLHGSGSGTAKTNVTLPEGSCFAYLLAKIDWKMKGLKKDKVEKLTDDQWGMS